jgi:hypothetical protein
MAPPSFRQAKQIMQMMRPEGRERYQTQKSMPGLLIPGNITNLYNRVPLQRPEGPPWYGDVSTATTMGIGIDDSGREIIIPTVVDGVDLGEEGARTRFEETGKHFGMFDTRENAQAYTKQLHDRMNRIQGSEASWLMRLLQGSPRPGPDR